MTTETQNMQALALGNELRLKMSGLKKRIGALPYDEGCDVVSALLLDDDLPDHIDAMRIECLLGAINRVGSHALGRIRFDAKFLRRDVRVRDLTRHEKARLAEVLRQRSRRPA